MKNIIILLSVFLSFQSHAVRERDVLSTFGPMLRTQFTRSTVQGEDCLNPTATNFYKLCQFRSPFGAANGLNIGYTKFGSRKGRLGSLVIAPGRTESSLKYIEVAHDFIRRGYSPVYAIDHRSQGFSDRTQSETHKVHATNFDHYVSDFNKFVEDIVKKDSNVNLDRLFVISNSMGGAITALYLEQYEDHPFKATAMFGAMHKIVYPKPFNEWLALLAGQTLCLPIFQQVTVAGLKCQEFAPGRGGRFEWDRRMFEGNNLTSSEARFRLRDILWREFPMIQTGGVTVQWAGTAALNNKLLRANADKLTLPMRVYTAEFDTIVERDGHVEVCRKAQNCRHIIVPSSKHEILMERQAVRSPSMDHMWEFFESL